MRADRSTSAARPIVVLARVVDLVLLVLVVIGLSSVVLGRVLPALGHPVYVVGGPSMAPAIPMGAAIVLESVPPSALAVGDVVSLQSGPDRAVFTHRITRLADRDGEVWIETKGDANPKQDPSITPTSAVIGRVTASIPFAGYALALLSTPPGVVLVLSTGALLIVFGWWLDDVAAARRRSARRAGAIEAPVARPPAIQAPVIEARPTLTAVVASLDAGAAGDPGPVSATERLTPDASARRRARHPIPSSGPARRRSSRSGRTRPTGQGA